MAAKGRYRDRRKVPATTSTYIHGECGKERHRRRKRHALEFLHKLRAEVKMMGGELRVLNDSHHYIIKLPCGTRFDWWPSSAKLVINEDWKEGIHVHDVESLLSVMKGDEGNV